MRNKLQKLQGHTSNLLTAFVQLRERYALLDPMLHDNRVSLQYGSGRQARGYAVLRWSLFLDCCHDLANICFDIDNRTPSICKLVLDLRDIDVRRYICKQHSKARLASELCDIPAWRAAMYKQVAQAAAIEYSVEFDQRFKTLDASWAEFEKSPIHQSFKTIRNKITAHTELRCVNNQYRPVEVNDQPVEWSHLKPTIELTQQIITALCDLISDASIAWDSIDRMMINTSEFWDERTSLPYQAHQSPGLAG
jgi:hypothetical protein